ncbi:hypothetical protein At1D1108_53310 (plasmid) [Agrobacterium tumefaciens]|nr:hypothetical protein At1D1108_53310 [Agrobacterium tumefaciens]
MHRRTLQLDISCHLAIMKLDNRGKFIGIIHLSLYHWSFFRCSFSTYDKHTRTHERKLKLGRDHKN